MNVEIGCMGIPKVITTKKHNDGTVEVHADVEFWWGNHDDQEATVRRVPVHFTNPVHFHDIEAEIRPPLKIPSRETSSTAQKRPLLVVMTFNAPANLNQPITGELLKQEGMEIRITQEPDAKKHWE